jgi:hypothetical protein
MWALVTLALATGGGDLVIRSGTDCPAAADVAAELAPLLPAGASVTVAAPAPAAPGPLPAGAADLVHIVVERDRRYVRLVEADGRVVHERILPASLGCAAAARSAAVSLAAWQFQGRADLPPVSASPPPARPIAASAGASPAAAETSGSTAAARPGRPPEPSVTAAVTVRAPPPARPLWLVGVGAGASLGRTVTARPWWGAVAELTLGRAQGVGAFASFGASSGHEVAVEPGRARWSQISGKLGITVTGRYGPWGAALHGGLAGARMSIAGEGFAINEAGTQWAVGVDSGVRALRTFGRNVELWLDVTAVSWLGDHQVFVRNVAGARDLPSSEASVGLGMRFFVWP